MTTTHAPARFLRFAVLCLVLCLPVAATAQNNPTPNPNEVYKQNTELREQLRSLEQKITDLEGDLDDKQNDLRERIVNRQQGLDSLQNTIENITGLIGIIIAIVGIVAWQWYKGKKEEIEKIGEDVAQKADEIDEDFKQTQKKLEGVRAEADTILNEIKGKKEEATKYADLFGISEKINIISEINKKSNSLFEISEEANIISEINKKGDVSRLPEVKAIANNEKLEPFLRNWAQALVRYINAIQSKKYEDFISTIDAYQNLLNNHPDKINFNLLADIYFKMGYCHDELKNYATAYNYYHTVTTLNPNDAIAYINKGNVLAALGKNEEAIACYNTATTINPNYADAYYNKGNVLDDLGKHKAAIACYDKAIELLKKEDQNDSQIKENLVKTYSNKGGALVVLGNNKAAIACYDTAIPLNPNNAKAYIGKGLALERWGDTLKEGKPDEALEKYKEAEPCYEKAFAKAGENNKLKAIAEEGLKRVREKIEELTNGGNAVN